MTAGTRDPLDALVEAGELARQARAWRHALATAAAIVAVVPWLLAPAAPSGIVRGATALWSSLLLGWLALVLEERLLARRRRRLARQIAVATTPPAPAPGDDADGRR